MSIPVFEAGDTRQFTWTGCAAPDAAPHFSVLNPSKVVIVSVSVQTSGSLAYYQFFTMPTSTGHYRFTWVATKTVGSSAYPFVDRGLFKVEETKVG